MKEKCTACMSDITIDFDVTDESPDLQSIFDLRTAIKNQLLFACREESSMEAIIQGMEVADEFIDVITKRLAALQVVLTSAQTDRDYIQTRILYKMIEERKQ